MKDVKQIIVQNSFFGEPKVTFAMIGMDPTSLEKNKIEYDKLTQEEKEIWDNFVELIKSKV